MRSLPAAPGVERRTIVRALVAVALVAGAVAAVRRAPGGAKELADAATALGPLAVAAFPAIYVPWMVLGIPIAPLSLAAGFALGPIVGWLVALAGCALGSCAAFLVGRGIAHHAVERLAARVPAIAPVRRAVGSHGFRVVLLLRLAPVMPIPFLNHVLGATPLALRSFLLATLLGSAPNALVFASVGDLLRNAGRGTELSAVRLDGAALVAALLASAALGWLALRILARELGTPR